MHGDMSQMERNEVITSFKKKEMPILVATDVAGNYTDKQAGTGWYGAGRDGMAGRPSLFQYIPVDFKVKNFKPSVIFFGGIAYHS